MMPPMQMDINDPLNIVKIRINFAEIGILEVKTVSNNINHFYIGLVMPPMQMDIIYPLKVRK